MVHFEHPPAPKHKHEYNPNIQQELFKDQWYDNVPRLAPQPTPVKNPQGRYRRFHFHSHKAEVKVSGSKVEKERRGQPDIEFLKEIEETIVGGQEDSVFVGIVPFASEPTTELPFYLTLPETTQVKDDSIHFCVKMMTRSAPSIPCGTARFEFTFSAYTTREIRTRCRTVHKFYPRRFYVQLETNGIVTPWKLWTFSRPPRPVQVSAQEQEIEKWLDEFDSPLKNSRTELKKVTSTPHNDSHAPEVGEEPEKPAARAGTKRPREEAEAGEAPVVASVWQDDSDTEVETPEKQQINFWLTLYKELFA